MTRWGFLLINLGTPDSPRVPDVRRYLREFLSDPRVVDVNALLRWLFLNFVILPRRPAQSAAAYRLIWTERRSFPPCRTKSTFARMPISSRVSRQSATKAGERTARRSTPVFALALCLFVPGAGVKGQVNFQ